MLSAVWATEGSGSEMQEAGENTPAFQLRAVFYGNILSCDLFFFPQFWHFWQIRISEFKVSILRKNAGAQFLLYHFFFHRGANSHMSTKTHSLLMHAHPTHTFLHHYTATDMHTTSTPPPQRPPPLHPTALIKAERLQKVGANNKATFLHLSCFFFLRPLNYSCHQSVYKEVRLLSSSQEASDGGSSVLRTQCK